MHVLNQHHSNPVIELIVISLFQAVDQDKPDTDRSRVEYIVEKVVTSSVDKDSFYLNSTTGELSVQSPLDYESLLSSKGKILVEVIAADFGQPPLSSTATISVQVLDRNDVTAKFSEDNYIATVQENSPPGKLESKLFLLCLWVLMYLFPLFC